MKSSDRIPDELKHLARPINSFNLDPSNVRKHNKKNLDAIKSSLSIFGQRKPIVVQRDGMVVRAGNGTLQAALELGWNQIAALIIDEDSTTAAQFAIADNRTGELAEWDEDALLRLLDTFDTDVREALAFTDRDIASLLSSINDSEEEIDPVDNIMKDAEPMASVVTYNLVFDDEGQQEEFYAFMRQLKSMYPDIDTGAGRLMQFIRDNG